jgi:hypothetical protein
MVLETLDPIDDETYIRSWEKMYRDIFGNLIDKQESTMICPSCLSNTTDPKFEHMKMKTITNTGKYVCSLCNKVILVVKDSDGKFVQKERITE